MGHENVVQDKEAYAPKGAENAIPTEGRLEMLLEHREHS